MKRTLLLCFVLLTITLAVPALAQTPTVAKAEDQAALKPLLDTEKKAREALNAKIATLPEAKAYKDAEEALKKAAANLNAAAEKLPESAAVKTAGAATLDMAYRLQAKYQLSSREYRPELNTKGELAFVKIPQP